MKFKAAILASGLLVSLFSDVCMAEQHIDEGPGAYGHGDDAKMPNGVIGAVIQVGAERIGEPAALYVIKVRQDGPARQAGLRHGDEIVAVNGTPVRGKSYEQIVSMIRGEAGTPVKLEIRGTRELSIMRVAGEKFRLEHQSGMRDEQNEQVGP
ncbi:MAG: PDZ domain-containing protein [Nitrospira sp.]